jgi:2-succinyl-5-enolpyruvyl-6-hydroxy-3-cyclohexene-1-carboxylate synthase
MSAWNTAVDGVTRCLRAGISEFVVCGGARNVALLEALARAENAGKLRTWRHFEERGAGFFALGRTMATGKPCAVVTTSGTATAELLPAAIEAFYQARPLVLLTADRPAAFRHSGAPQTIDQIGLFGCHAVSVAVEEWDGCGPLHWNIELDEEFSPGEENFQNVTPCEWQSRETPPAVADLARWLREDAYRGFVVMVGGLEPDEREEVFHFCRDFGAPVVAEATSGLREALAALAIHDADRVLALHPPGKILRLGEVPSGRIWRDLESLTETGVWSVCRNGLPGLARPSHVTSGRIDRILRALGDVDPVDDALDLLIGASARASALDELLESYPDSEPALMRAISHFTCIGSGVFLGNSLPIREWNQFAQWMRPVTDIRANRGANGIDGQISTWLGCSAEQADSWAILGDLTALYDLAAPALLGQVENTGRVLAVINNRGGRIFERLPRLQTMLPSTAESLIQPQQADFSGLATLWGMRHLRIRTADDFDQLESEGPPLLLEIIPDGKQTTRFWEAWVRTK